MLRSMMVILVAAFAAGTVLSGCSSPEKAEKVEDTTTLVTAESVCDDGKDEDGDGTTDCDDSDCGESDICRCRTVCATIMECEGIVDACSDKELTGVLAGCQDSCSKKETRSQLIMADGVPCFVIGSVFLGQVQSNGLCMGEEAPADGA